MSDAVCYQATVSTPVGKIGVRTSDDHLLGIDYLYDDSILVKPKTILAKETVEQLLCYFADPEFPFEIPIALGLTPFQETVLNALRTIPVGTTRTYAQLAEQLDTRARPIGNACRKNPIPIIIPCHRVVAATHLGGYSSATKGKLLAVKQWLLQHESASFESNLGEKLKKTK
ncbi:methylated-DNA--[protein]-cysteine S-methyltransferase [Coxiella burnetii]|uniref:O6-methylguanine-DNA methyltransferase n=2 Tax=Coxiella burnetii TaxID=777 RepID=Q83E86_COXBU|nr:methylated-DNA--[protein]-cysteine S-methyltransferase [Coxiella burnetii]NP_819478.1 O6-methylguanine-DNA methyltransferase [Coxiella burnetii RSA 493]AAO89992.1 O6-methylguanine-DNA methyltransferase [Coxiella burnetii RSA 493]ABX78537.1 methylated-DNA-[protein]-cysteine S-methyltransferase [Coxiella burnetii RSA 331]AML48759.1 cysteine methyltransferase [Coxiella burnetii]AML54729.1 cysteine methyltransferase [Coxiella burnetii]ARI65320.1 methylated-DNA--[protein]-cysteine S-methyltrans